MLLFLKYNFETSTTHTGDCMLLSIITGLRNISMVLVPSNNSAPLTADYHHYQDYCLEKTQVI